MTRRADRYSTTEIGEEEGGSAFPTPDKIFPQGEPPKLGIPRINAAKIQSENEELKGQLSEAEEHAEQLRQEAEQLREQLAAQASGLTVQDGGLMVQGFQFSPTGLIPPEDISYEAWKQVGILLFKLEGSIQWLVGDWLAYGEDVNWGDVTEIANSLGRLPSTLHDYTYVARHVKFSFRKENLTYTHHAVVASLDADEQMYALNEAVEKKLSVAALKQLVKRIKGEVDIPALPAGDIPDIKAVVSDVQKFLQRDPSTFKQKDREAAQSHADRLYRLADAIKRHAGLRE
jgi:hypothetical protein